jgi:hypothetical protein
MAGKRFVKLAAISTAIADFVSFWRKRKYVEDEAGPATPGLDDAAAA